MMAGAEERVAARGGGQRRRSTIVGRGQQLPSFVTIVRYVKRLIDNVNPRSSGIGEGHDERNEGIKRQIGRMQRRTHHTAARF